MRAVGKVLLLVNYSCLLSSLIICDNCILMLFHWFLLHSSSHAGFSQGDNTPTLTCYRETYHTHTFFIEKPYRILKDWTLTQLYTCPFQNPQNWIWSHTNHIDYFFLSFNGNSNIFIEKGDADNLLVCWSCYFTKCYTSVLCISFCWWGL